MNRYKINELHYKYFWYGKNGATTSGDCWNGSICYCEPSEDEDRTSIWMIKSICDWDPGRMEWMNSVNFDAEILSRDDYPEYYL